MSDSILRANVIRLAHAHPEFRETLLPLLTEKSAAVGPGGQWTPWGTADESRPVVRGVNWYNTPGHGGLSVAQAAARKYLSAAALKCASFENGAYWFEEDVAASVAFYEQPGWSVDCGFRALKSEDYAESIRESFPKYFENLGSEKHLPPLRNGLRLLVTRSVTGLSQGDIVTVTKVQGGKFLADNGSQPIRASTSHYFGDKPLFVPAE